MSAFAAVDCPLARTVTYTNAPELQKIQRACWSALHGCVCARAAYGAAAQDPYAAAAAFGAASAAAPAAASVWQALPDDQGRTYYYNSQTGQSQWEKPAEMPW